MNREEFIIPNVRKALIFGCQDSYNNNKEIQIKQKEGIKEVHSDMKKLEDFLDLTLKFDECKSYKDTQKNGPTLFDTINHELTNLLMTVSDVGEGNQHQVIVIAFFGHGGKFYQNILIIKECYHIEPNFTNYLQAAP